MCTALLLLVVGIVPPVNVQVTGIVTEVERNAATKWADKPSMPHVGDSVVADVYYGRSSGRVTMDVGPHRHDGLVMMLDMDRVTLPPDGNLGTVYGDLDTLTDTFSLYVQWDGTPAVGWERFDLPVRGTFIWMARPIGDSNLDGVFDSADMVAVFQAGQYENDVADDSAFVTGDWNADRDFNSADFIAAFETGQYEQPVAAVAVPETSSLLLLFAMGLAVMGRRESTAQNRL